MKAGDDILGVPSPAVTRKPGDLEAVIKPKIFSNNY